MSPSTWPFPGSRRWSPRSARRRLPTSDVRYEVGQPVSLDDLQTLFAVAWPDGGKPGYERVLARSLTYVCAYVGDRLVAFVNIAWDGGMHGFVVDTTVHPEFQRRGIGTALLREAADAARARGLEWLHVDYEPALDGFYKGGGFVRSTAGVRRL